MVYTKLQKKNKDNRFLLLGLLLVFILRVIFLDRFPIGITHDELNYIISAKSLFLTHSFAPGTAPAILPTGMADYTVTVAEVPVFILTPFIGPVSFSLFMSRMIGALLSVTIALALFLIVKNVTGKRSLAYATLLLVAINPWSFLMGRSIFEVNFFVAFFLWGFWILIKNKGWKVLYALPLYLLGFFSYTGGQISFYLFMVASLIYHYFENKKVNKKMYLLFFFFITAVLIGYFLVVFRNQSFTTRGGEIYLPTRPEVAQMVDEERKFSVPSGINKLFINKATVFFNGFLDKYLNAFSINNLFLTGESRAAFSFQEHGNFYFIDLIFIIFGLCYLFTINRKACFLVLTVIMVAPLTSGLNVVEYSYSQRAGLMYPFLIILTGLGMGSFILSINSVKLRKMFTVLVVGLYLLLFANLLHIYFYRFPVYASDGWFFQDRLLAKYIGSVQKKSSDIKIRVFSSEPKIVFEEYLFYSDSYNRTAAKNINSLMAKGEYSSGNLEFINKCPTDKPREDEVYILDNTLACDRLPWMKDPVRITRFRDVYENYLIYNDKLCRDLKLGTYVNQSVYSNFTVEKQSPDMFCLNWITKIN